jgi:rSAM/selenodomain-associated transferase 1
MSERLQVDQVAVLVIAKEPVAGRAKTRLIPALGEHGSAAVAEAALADTLAAVAAAPVHRRVLVLEGEPGRWLPSGFTVVPQVGGGLGARLAAAFAAAGGPALLVGMDTPQITPELIAEGSERLGEKGVDAVIGLAEDGGWWALGLRAPDARVFEGVPMSEESTGAEQIAALQRLRLSLRELPRLRDVDTFEDARRVAASIPASRFARAVGRLAPEST